MAQYTTSIKSIVELDAYRDNIPPYQLTIDDYISRGRKLLFDFGYTGDKIFKEYFEKTFISKYLLENINNDFVPLWLQNLENIVQISAPLYYLKYQGLNQLTIDKMLSDGIRITDINKSGTSESEADGKENTNASNTHTGSESGSSTTTDKKTGTLSTSDSVTDSRTSTGSGSGSSTNVNSAFPASVASGTNINSINYKTDGGKVESSNTASNTDSGEKTENKTDTYNLTDKSDSENERATSDTSENTVERTNKDTKNDSYKSQERAEEHLTGNLLNKVMELYTLDFNPIESFVNELYKKLFILLW